jgi:hypothetical protein
MAPRLTLPSDTVMAALENFSLRFLSSCENPLLEPLGRMPKLDIKAIGFSTWVKEMLNLLILCYSHIWGEFLEITFLNISLSL